MINDNKLTFLEREQRVTFFEDYFFFASDFS